MGFTARSRIPFRGKTVVAATWPRPSWWHADRRSGNLSTADLTALPGNAVDIVAWLRELGLERYEQAFRENEIAADILPKLTC